MPQIRLSEVPEYLREGEFYKSMNDNSEDPDEILSFDASVLKQNTSVNNSHDCDHLLNSLRFWGAGKFCEEVAAFVLNLPSEKNDAILAKYEEQFPYARALRMIKKTYGKRKKIKGQLGDAIETGCVEVVEYLLKGKSVLPQLEDACLRAAQGGCLEMLKYVHQRGYPLNFLVVRAAVEHGHVNCLRYAHMNGAVIFSFLLMEAADFGHLACLQYLHQKGCTWDPKASFYAALGGHLSCLQYAHENGCPWHPKTCLGAAINGHLHCLQYAHEHGCEWETWSCNMAAAKGHLLCLQYAIENGCPADAETCCVAALMGRLDSLKYLHEHRIVWDERTCAGAAGNGRIECLKYAHMHGCPWDENTCTAAAKVVTIIALSMRMRMAVSGVKDTYAAAVKKGHQGCLQYVRAKGCPSV